MKKTIIIITLILLIFLTSCTVQEKLNPQIFVERFNESYPEYKININELYFDENKYFCFISNNNVEYAMQLYCDNDDNIKKICLVCDNTNKTDYIKRVFSAVINTYAPSEDPKVIVNLLISGDKNYHNTQWYRYSFSSSENFMFFSVENMKISTETDAELTLKQNDIISFR